MIIKIMNNQEKKFAISNQEIELQLIKKDEKSGTCWSCKEYKEIRLISERKNGDNDWEIRKFCRTCSLHNLDQLEESDYEIENKSEIIKQLRKELTNHE